VDTPFFSVITPNFNSGVKLLRAAKSLSKNKVNFEHIVVDDCSTDGSFKLPRELESSTNCVRNEKNLGPGPSRNKGLDIARGRYVIFMDSDDFFVSGALDSIHQALTSEGCPDVLIFGYYLDRSGCFSHLEGDAKLELSCSFLPGRSVLLQKYFLDEIVSAPWGKCISSNLTKGARFPSLRVSQDAFYNLDIFLKTESAIITDDKLYVFDKSDSQSLTSKPFDYSEFKKFYRSWVAFERKVLNDPTLIKYRNLIYARKVKFCVLYYMNRLALTPNSERDSRVVEFVKGLFLKNVWLARKNLTGKSIAASFLFCIFPRFTLRVLRARLLKESK